MILVLALCLSGCGTQESSKETKAAKADLSPEEYVGTVTLWHWDAKSVEVCLEDFNKAYPNIKVEVVGAPGDYVDSLRNSIAGGLELPDMVMMDTTWRGELMEWGIFEDLSKDPYNLDTSIFLDYIVPTLYSASGELITVPWDVGICGMAYNKAAAKKWLGTDDRAELEAMLPTWEAFAQKAKEIQQASDGKAYMTASAVPMMTIISNQDKSPLIVDHQLQIEKIQAKLKTMVMLRDAGAFRALKDQSPGYLASINSTNYIFWHCAPWVVPYTLVAYADKVDDTFGMIIPPEGPSISGGAGVAIVSRGKTDHQKMLAYKFLQWFLCSEEGAWSQRRNNDFYIHVKKAYEDPAYVAYGNSLFGNQDLGNIWFNEMVNELMLRPTTVVDRYIYQADCHVAQSMAENKELTYEELWVQWAKDYNNNEPDGYMIPKEAIESQESGQ